MKLTVIQADNVVMVDGESRQVNLGDLDTRIHAIHYDSDTDMGEVEFDQGVTVERRERDLEAEQAAIDEAVANNQPVPTAEIYKTVWVQAPNQTFRGMEHVQEYYNRWLAAAPELVPPTPEELEAAKLEEQRLADMDQEIYANTLGSVEPKTIADLKAMRRAELRAWFDANFTTDAQKTRLLRWIFIVLIRRVL